MLLAALLPLLCQADVRTPPCGPEPRLRGARLTGVRPGHPFLYGIPATGERPMKFSAESLPEGLALDPATGRISGTLAKAGDYVVQLWAKNARGANARPLHIVCGETIALTPPLGWSSWNCFGKDVDDAKVRAAADALVASGLAQHGWSYIDLDDGWQAGRDAQGNILSNAKFPDMQALGDYIHAQGLRFGISSSPGPRTCADFGGSYQHEQQDVATWAAWGVDSVTYDWCSYAGLAKDQSLPELKKPYLVLREALAKTPRDIVFRLSQSGVGDVWQWGAEVGGNSWRTGADIEDTWESVAGIGFTQHGREKHAGPGHWNDPGLLAVGKLGSGNLHPTRLSPDEQYAQVTLWCLLAAPLRLGCDLAQLDAFTLGLLTNDEVLEVDQDPLGIQAARVSKDGEREVWAKMLEDGSLAVGLFNRGPQESSVSAVWKDLGIAGPRRVRDLWRQADIGPKNESYAIQVPSHGAALLRLIPVRGH